MPQLEEEETGDEIHFETKPEEKSSRNIPPLVIEDSDRTVSTPNSEEYRIMFQLDDSTYRKTFILSPVPEKIENRSESEKTIQNVADTSSELSSLPEDSDSKKRARDQPEPECCPTFSIRDKTPTRIKFSMDFDESQKKISENLEKKSDNVTQPEDELNYHRFSSPRKIIADCKFNYSDKFSSDSSENENTYLYRSDDEKSCQCDKNSGFRVVCESVARMNCHTFSATTEIISNLSTPKDGFNDSRDYLFDRKSVDDLGNTDSEEFRFSDSYDQDIDETTFSIEEKRNEGFNFRYHLCGHK